MASWPRTWVQQVLSELNVDPTPERISLINAWKDSTPLPPFTNNPLGMPASMLGANRYLNTDYGLFPTMQMFYAAFASWARTYQGSQLKDALTSDVAAPKVWRLVSGLAWPGSRTESDYPSRVLDLTTVAYRASAGAKPKGERKTSGAVGVPAHSTSEILEQSRMISEAGQSVIAAGKVTGRIVRGKSKNGK